MNRVQFVARNRSDNMNKLITIKTRSERQIRLAAVIANVGVCVRACMFVWCARLNACVHGTPYIIGTPEMKMI